MAVFLVTIWPLELEMATDILAAIRLPLEPRMSLPEVQQLLGTPKETHRFVTDHLSFDFAVDSRYPYQVECTIHEAQGLIHLTVIREDLLTAA